MREAGLKLVEFVKTLLARPDAIMLEVGAGGELLVARLRAVLSMLILVMPLVGMLVGSPIDEALIGLAASIFVIIVSQVWLLLARSRQRYPWLPYVTSTYDITMTTLVLALLSMSELPAGVNSMVVWGFYSIGIVMTALRNDGRLVLYVGVLAIVQYVSLVWAVLAAAQSPEHLLSVEYGAVTMANQIQRVMLLALMTIIVATVVYRMQRLVEMSGTDGLTQLPNRTWLLHRMPRLFDAARHDGATLTLALINIDYFKRINDEIGHLAGDRALRHVVAVLSGLIGTDEWLIRLGGEEFVLVLRKPIGSAWERVDNLRRAVAESHFIAERGAEPQRITFSAGLAGFPNDGGDTSMLLKRADLRLQQAKREGRNRVVARDE
ncbi:diguanylate cyclase (GGDEF)-like protein [Luteimonas cucumeris]|uniref:diguanylate cyclase n=1 Tax=Luteimonas cucumeris TaxID=985012 RepID=A0A562LFB6_9GAMM|nr:GGDEF domain-containing protein [Luteimonas cucumeris]TWI06295.1 diguanylate cyclase (GGDEF)-like protein [Luteimonas cucumeris]